MQFRFGDFVFDRETGLSRAEERVPLEPLAEALLRHLLENAGRIVSRDELQERLWDGRIVTDAAISTQIRTVRRALGDDRARQRFIRTHPKRGFEFAAPVTPAEPGAAAPPASTSPSARPRRRVLAAAAAAAALLVAGAAALWWPGGEGPGAGPPRLSIVVLPFDNLSGDRSRDYLADAFTEDLVTDLSRIRDAFVISRSTSFTYRGRNVDAVTAARELDVRYVLEGGLRVEGDNVRINAQLVDGAAGARVWSDRYDLPLDALFDVKENVTGRISSVLRAELRVTDSERQHPVPGSQAWEHALRGNVILFGHETVADYQEAFDHLSRAVAIDPSIALA